MIPRPTPQPGALYARTAAAVILSIFTLAILLPAWTVANDLPDDVSEMELFGEEPFVAEAPQDKAPDDWKDFEEQLDEGPVAVPEIEVPDEEEPALQLEEAGDAFGITDLKITGDSDFFQSTVFYRAMVEDTVGKDLSRGQMVEIADKYRNILNEKGYYLASIRVVPRDYGDGVLIVHIDMGRIGTMSFHDPAAGEDDLPPFSQVYFSESQIRSRLAALSEGDFFNYNRFYRHVYSLNTHPDLTLHTYLKLRKEADGMETRRYADMVFRVNEQLPLHGIFEIKNTGTESTEEWRASLSAQHLNLTKNDDILTLNLLSSVDLSSLMSFAGSYYLPHSMGKGGAFTFYAGYSEVEAEDIVPLIDLVGDGWFAGAQCSVNLVNNEEHLLTLSGSALFRNVGNSLSLQECEGEEANDEMPGTDVSILPLSLALSYSSIKPDSMGGRNFITAQSSFNIGGSDEEELSLERDGAEKNYFIERIQAARLQPLFGTGEGERKKGQWLLFLKAVGQISSCPLIPAEQIAAGGMDTVRGYAERDILGDNGVMATIELRTPLFSGVLGDLFEHEQAGKADALDRFQFVGFLDAAYLALDEDIEGEDTSQSLLGAGAGIRVGLTRHSQLKLDVGIPLEETLSSDSLRVHVSAQAQF